MIDDTSNTLVSNRRQNFYRTYNNKTSQNTPTKSGSNFYDRGSEERRKSLIEKSQILK